MYVLFYWWMNVHVQVQSCNFLCGTYFTVHGVCKMYALKPCLEQAHEIRDTHDNADTSFVLEYISCTLETPEIRTPFYTRQLRCPDERCSTVYIHVHVIVYNIQLYIYNGTSKWKTHCFSSLIREVSTILRAVTCTCTCTCACITALGNNANGATWSVHIMGGVC